MVFFRIYQAYINLFLYLKLVDKEPAPVSLFFLPVFQPSRLSIIVAWRGLSFFSGQASKSRTAPFWTGLKETSGQTHIVVMFDNFHFVKFVFKAFRMSWGSHLETFGTTQCSKNEMFVRQMAVEGWWQSLIVLYRSSSEIIAEILRLLFHCVSIKPFHWILHLLELNRREHRKIWQSSANYKNECLDYTTSVWADVELQNIRPLMWSRLLSLL